MKVEVAFAAVFVMLVLSCGSGTQPQSGTVSVEEDESQPLLVFQNQIGVELGDSNFVFGIIQDVDFTPEGNIAVLDAQKKIVKLYSPDGAFLGEFGGEGEAPGEFLNPRGIACFPDGRFAVTDPFSGEVEIFGADLQHSETFSDFAGRAPFVITAAGNGFAGEQGGFNRTEGILTTSLAIWQPGSDSVSTFFETENSFSPEYVVERIMKPQAGLCANEENLYYSSPACDRYSVSVYPVNGSAPYELTFPDYSPVERSAEDIQKDVDAFESRRQSMASSGRGSRLAGVTYEPPSDYYATSSIGTDAEDNVWVQRGWVSNPTFDLFQPGETVPFKTVTVDPELGLSDYTFAITPYGIAAFNRNPEDFPRVFVLSLVD